MRIGLVYHDLNIGGGPYQLLSFAHMLSKEHDVTLFVNSDLTGNFFSDLKKNITIKKVHNNNDFSKNGRLNSLLLPITRTISMSKLLMKDNLDIINAYDVYTYWPAVLIKFIKKTPVVWTCFDLWHVPGLEESKENRMIFWLFKRTIIWWLDLFFIRQLDQIVVLHQSIQKKILDKYNCNSIVVRSGIDQHRFSKIVSQKKAKEALGIKSNFLFLCFSIFSPHRRFEDAILALKPILREKNNIMLAIVGSTMFNKNYANYIRTLITSLGLRKKIILDTNLVPEKKLLTYLSACDVFVYPSERTTWGLSVIEEMFIGKPCVVSDDTGASEIIKNGKNGYVFKVKDIDRLSTLCKRLYENPNLRKKMGENASNYVRKNLSWNVHTQIMLKIFNNILKHEN